MEGNTRRPSEGSVPATAPARAAVNDSTSSRYSGKRRYDGAGICVHTNQDDHKSIFLLNEFVDATEEPLDQLPGLGEPLGEQGMRVDFH